MRAAATAAVVAACCGAIAAGTGVDAVAKRSRTRRAACRSDRVAART